MYIIKNVWTSITRNKGRNILMIIIVMVIAAACAITLAIRNSANTLVEAYENKYDIEATISFDRSKLMQNFTPGADNTEDNIEAFNNIESITIDEINNYGTSDYVDYYYYTYSIGVNSSDIDVATDQMQKVTTETKTTRKEFPGGGFPGGFGGGSETTTTTKKVENIFNMRGTSGDFTVTGYSSYEGMSEFVNGNYTITDGKVSSDFNSYNCVINSELANLNELEVGDTITLENVDSSKLTYELTITGIYTDNSDNSTDMKQMYSSSVNTIITNTKVVEKMVSDDEDASVTITPIFILKSKDVADKFSEEVTSKGLNENYQVTNNIESITSETESITNVKSFATTFLIITLIIGGVVLLIVNMINVRERKYEIGVLRTIGMKKSSVTLQFMIELLVISFIGLLLGAAIGATSSVSIANKMLASEIASAEESKNNISKNFGGMSRPDNIPEDIDNTIETADKDNTITTEEESETKLNGVVDIKGLDSINAVVDIKVLLQLMGIGLLLTLFSSMSAMISIAKFSPLTILKERS